MLSLRAVLLPLALFATTSCASLVGGGSAQHVSIRSTPTAATFTILSSSGLQMAQGQTPDTVRLPRKNEYQIEFTAPGFQPQKVALTRGTNSWIWGNLLIGWIVGFAIDFGTGSAYKLEPALVEITLVESRTTAGLLETNAVIRLLDDKGKLIRTIAVPMVPEVQGVR